MDDTKKTKQELIKELKMLRDQLADRDRDRSAGAAPHKSEEKYHDLFEYAGDAIFLVDAELNYTDVNKKAVELSGYSRKELLTMNILDLVPEEQWPRSEEEFAKLRREYQYRNFRGRLKTKSGQLLDIEVNSSAIVEDGRLIGSRDIVRDITDQVRTEEELRESEEKCRTIFDNAKDGILILHTGADRFVEANSTICRMLGYSREEIMNLRIRDIHPEGDLPHVLALIEQQMNSGKIVTEDIPVKRKDGTVFYADISSSKIRLGGDECFVGIFRDISDKKQTENAMRMTNTRLRTLIEAIPDMILFKDAEGRHLIVNRAVEEMTGHGREEFIGRTVDDLLPPAAAAECRKSDNEVMHATTLTPAEEQEFEVKGQKRYVEMVKAPIIDAGNNVVGLVAIGRDVTERKQTEAALRNSEHFIRTILDSVDEGFIVVNREFRIMTANKAYGEQTGVGCDAAIGRHCYEVCHQFSRPCYEVGSECAVFSALRTGKPAGAIHQHRSGRDEMIHVETRAFPIKDASGAVTAVIETINNISERRLLEEERIKTQKLEAIGMLAGGIAHDFNNLLQGVFGYISMAKMRMEPKDRTFEMLMQAEQALHLSVNLTNQLLTFSKGGKPVKKPIPLAPVVENSVKFALSGSRTDYRLNIPPDLWMVEADEGQIAQAIQNIVLNADQAMPLGGTVSVEARNSCPPHSRARHLLREVPYVEISIGDTGIGISERHLHKIFDPYFTTKEKGSGLSLATAYSIIKNHGGVIDVDSTVDRGTTVRLYLTAIEGHVEPPAANAPMKTARRGKILVMDDEELVRQVSHDLLDALGHDVVLAENGEAAIRQYRDAKASGTPFDVVILDLTVRNGMGGIAAFQQLSVIDPAVKAVMSSGYSDDASTANYRSLGFKVFLKKPYRLIELEEVLNTLLA
ncbi:MAG: hybrid sensor histidine kinase/response regulator [Syntrophales bacterium]